MRMPAPPTTLFFLFFASHLYTPILTFKLIKAQYFLRTENVP